MIFSARNLLHGTSCLIAIPADLTGYFELSAYQSKRVDSELCNVDGCGCHAIYNQPEDSQYRVVSSRVHFGGLAVEPDVSILKNRIEALESNLLDAQHAVDDAYEQSFEEN